MKRRGSISWGDCLLHAFFALVLTYTVYLFLTITSGTSHWWMLAAFLANTAFWPLREALQSDRGLHPRHWGLGSIVEAVVPVITGGLFAIAYIALIAI